MRNLSLVLALAVVVFAASGCISFTTPVQPPNGGIWSQYKAPLSTDFNNTKSAGKTGRSEVSHVWIWPLHSALSATWDDASIQRAAASGGITQVAYVDYEWMQVLGIYGRLTVIAHGE